MELYWNNKPIDEYVPKHVANPEASLKLKKLGFLVILLSLVNPYSCKAPPLVKPKTSLQL